MPVTKSFGHFFRFVECDKPQRTTSRGPIRYSDIYCGNYYICFFGHKILLKNQFFLKSHFRVKKLDWLNFYRDIEYKIPPQTTFTGSKRMLTFIVQVIRSFQKDLRDWQKKSSRRANSPVKNFSASFFGNFRGKQASNDNRSRSTSISDKHCASYKIFFWDLRGR